MITIELFIYCEFYALVLLKRSVYSKIEFRDRKRLIILVGQNLVQKQNSNVSLMPFIFWLKQDRESLASWLKGESSFEEKKGSFSCQQMSFFLQKSKLLIFKLNAIRNKCALKHESQFLRVHASLA